MAELHEARSAPALVSRPEWGQRIFGDPGQVDWPVEEESALGERNGPMAWIEYGLARGCAKLANFVPGPLRRGLLGGLARFAKWVTPKRTAAARDFIATAFPELSPGELDERVLTAWKHLFHITLASEEVEKRLVGRPLGEHFEFEIHEGAAKLLDEQSGCLFVGGHVGHWEIAPGVLSALGYRSLYVVGKPPKNRPLSRRVQVLREQLGVRVLPRRGAMRTVPTVLRSRGHVAMLLDQRARLKPAFAHFFGRLARCDRSAAVLIRRLKVPIVMGTCFATETPWRFRMILGPVIHPEELQEAPPEQVIERLNRELEAVVMRHPEQYFWLHDRYRDAPQTDELGPPE